MLRKSIRSNTQILRASPFAARRAFAASSRLAATDECSASTPSQTSPTGAQTPPAPLPPSSPPQRPAPVANAQRPDGFANIAAALRSSPVLRGTTEPYIAYGGTEDLFLECNRQCNYTIPAILQKPPGEPPVTADGEELGVGTGWWFEPKNKGGLELPVTFNTWAQVMFVYMWLLTVRFRCFPKEYVKQWDQHLLDHFFYAAEDRMATWHRMSSRSIRNRYLKDLWTQWRGVILSYDEGLVKGDAVLAAAVWRNLYNASETVDAADLATVSAYVLQELKTLGELQDEIVTEGKIKFGNAAGLQRSLLG
jgi:cytochrome b pre-mRNA-processing protein 3